MLAALFDASGNLHPLLRNADGTFVLPPNYSNASGTAPFTEFLGINDSSLVSGDYTFDPTGNTGFTGFLFSGNSYLSTFSFPGAVNTFADSVNNAGSVVGGFTTKTPGEGHGYLRDPDGTFHQIDFPGSKVTEAWGINNLGVIVGIYGDQKDVFHGFVLNGGQFSSLDYVDPNHDPNTVAIAINDKGQIAGVSWGDVTNYGFQADPVLSSVPEPATLALVGISLLLGSLVRLKRKHEPASL